MKKQLLVLIAFALIATCAYGADQVINLWGDADSYTAIILSGKEYYIQDEQDEQGKHGPYADVFPFDSKDGSRRAWGAEGDKKKGYTLIGDRNQRFGPYDYIVSYSAYKRAEGKSRLMIGGKYPTNDLIFCDGERLIFMSTVQDAVGDFVDFDREGTTAAVMVKRRFDPSSTITFPGIAIGSSVIPMPPDEWRTYGFLGEPENFWMTYQDTKDHCFYFLQIPNDEIEHLKLEADFSIGSLAKVSQPVLGLGGMGGSGSLTYSDDRSGMILKYETREGGYIFTGRETLGPYYCDKEWLKARDGAISADGKELVFPFKKKGENYQTYLYFRGNTVGPFDSIIEKPWFAKDGTDRAYARVIKGGKAYLLLDGREIGGPWDEIVNTIWGPKDVFQLVVKKVGQSLLFDPDTKAEEPLPPGIPYRFVKAGNHKGIVMSEGDYLHKATPHREWYVIDGKGQPKFDSVETLQVNGSDSASPIYSASQDFLWYIIDGEKKLGPYDQVGLPCFYKDGYAFMFRKGAKTFIGKSDGSSLALPFEPRELGGPSKIKCEAKDLSDLLVSEDGQIIQFDMALPVKGQEWPLYLHRVLVNGKPYVGHYDAASGTVLIWDEKAKEVKRLTAGR